MSPSRIQRKRTKGWRMPEGAVYVGRPTRWGNPYPVTVGSSVTAAQAVELYRAYAVDLPDLTELAGRDLACWCPLDQPCHADVLLEVANQ